MIGSVEKQQRQKYHDCTENCPGDRQRKPEDKRAYSRKEQKAGPNEEDGYDADNCAEYEAFLKMAES
jgi:hypothetical protein